MLPLSVVITTHNERDIIGRTLDAVAGLATETLVVDSFSDDGTAEYLAARPEVTLHQRAYAGPSDQKNWAIARATQPWVLLLDADEVVTPALRAEISRLLRPRPNAAPPLADAYWVHRNNYFLGRRIRHSGWAGERVIRLARRDRCRYNDRRVHEEVILDGLTTATLAGRLDHYVFKNLDHFWDKNRRYARWGAADRAGRTGRITAYHLLLKPLWRFLKHYLLQGGFRDGRAGLVLSLSLGYSVFQRYAYLLAERRGREVDQK